MEHEISIISALQACEYINREKYEVIPLYMTKGENFIRESISAASIITRIFPCC